MSALQANAARIASGRAAVEKILQQVEQWTHPNSTEGRWLMRTLSAFRLNLLRAFYLVLVIGLGMQVWPAMIHRVYSLPLDSGALTCMLWALSTLSILGVRYPVQMLPLLLFEIAWKLAWLLTVALPHWLRGQWNQQLGAMTFAVALIFVVIPLVPWSYVFASYVKQPGERWSRHATGVGASP